MNRWSVAFLLTFSMTSCLHASAAPSSKAPLKTTRNSAAVSEGKALFTATCQKCHSTGNSGGCLGPILAGEGSRRSKSFIESRISDDPKKVQEFLRVYGHAELMPHLRVAQAAAKKLAEYVASLPSVDVGFEVKGHAPQKQKADTFVSATEQSIAAGKKMVYERGCLMCHSFGGIGGQFAPAFDGIGSRHPKDYIAESISSAELLQGNSGREYGARGLVMPPSTFSESEIDSIASYLSSLK